LRNKDERFEGEDKGNERWEVEGRQQVVEEAIDLIQKYQMG
jgi:hypothetical protein